MCNDYAVPFLWLGGKGVSLSNDPNFFFDERTGIYPEVPIRIESHSTLHSWKVLLVLSICILRRTIFSTK